MNVCIDQSYINKYLHIYKYIYIHISVYKYTHIYIVIFMCINIDIFQPRYLYLELVRVNW
jgi:hypothetical protein